MATFSTAEYGKADFVLLDQVSEEAFMKNLKLRYRKGKIYSYIGERAAAGLRRSFLAIGLGHLFTSR